MLPVRLGAINDPLLPSAPLQQMAATQRELPFAEAVCQYPVVVPSPSFVRKDQQMSSDCVQSMPRHGALRAHSVRPIT